MRYCVYILECADGTLYVGATNDLARRLHAHNSLKSGARYTRTRRPVVVRYAELCRTRRGAMRREYALKKLTRTQKWELCARANPSTG
ncbi:MAG: GIY-YIG nuclease family protein [bacterium]|nr:GIY-YIG nuclease family protein [bacterium]MDZ4299668.1 GIY-YIG nuclease family protein [Candidatus Sungbacteria bacterium]